MITNQHNRHVLWVILLVLSLSFSGCVTETNQPAPENGTPSSIAQEENERNQFPPGDIQERGIPRMSPKRTKPQAGGVFSPDPTLSQSKATGPAVMSPSIIGLGMTASPAAFTTFPGGFAIRTTKGFYLTAVNGGGRISDPIVITSASSAGAWEKFKLAVANPQTSHDKFFQTANGNYVTAVNGGGQTTDVLHTDATQPKDWERFRLIDLGAGVPPKFTYYGIQTIKGNFLTAVGAGGKYQDAMHTDAKEIKGWEQFRIVKCGDPGSAFEYGIMAANGGFLTAGNGGGRTSEAIMLGQANGFDAKFTFFRQAEGTYAFRTANGKNYVTALGGGGQVQKYYPPDCGMFEACIGGFSTVFHTDATQIKGWEKFRVVDQGNCTYTIQTSSGFFVGIYKDSSGYTLLTTRRDGASTANEKFQLVVYGLASPPILR